MVVELFYLSVGTYGGIIQHKSQLLIVDKKPEYFRTL